MRLKEEEARRAEDRARLERRVEAAERDTGARGEELARLVVEFETRAACAEAEMDEKVAASFWSVPEGLFKTGKRGVLLDGGIGIGSVLVLDAFVAHDHIHPLLPSPTLFQRPWGGIVLWLPWRYMSYPL